MELVAARLVILHSEDDEGNIIKNTYGKGTDLPDLDPELASRLVRRGMAKPKGANDLTHGQKLTLSQEILTPQAEEEEPEEPAVEPVTTPQEPEEEPTPTVVTPEPSPDASDAPEPAPVALDALTNDELRTMADDLGVKYTSRDTKDDLIAAIESHEEDEDA